MVVRAVKPDRKVTDTEGALLRIARHAAESMEPLPKTDDLSAMIGVSNGGTISDMFHRLHDMGELELISYQRGRRVCFPDGLCTALPLNTAPHWRDRPKQTPSVSIETVRVRHPEISAQIITWASKRGVALCDAIADLVYVGWQAEKERG